MSKLCAAVDDPRPAPSTVIAVAHPDDEVIGAGARLLRLHDAVFVHVTDGAPRDPSYAAAAGFGTREDYARARREELAAALGLAGISPERMRRLDLIDQEASFHLAALSRRMAEIMRELRPEAALTLPYEGGHPDHDATAFAVHAACRLLREENIAPPAIIEMTSYHERGGAMSTFEFLPHHGQPVVTLILSEAERDLKRRMIDCFITQREALRAFPLELERFRPAPLYDFTRPPHRGLLYYERFDWGMAGDRWRSLARAALAELHIEGLI